MDILLYCSLRSGKIWITFEKHFLSLLYWVRVAGGSASLRFFIGCVATLKNSRLATFVTFLAFYLLR